jgi:DNA polymerase-1
MSKKRLFLIDGHSLLYRAYYAIRHLTNSQGFPTNAIFGFLSMMRKLQDKENPAYLGIVFDAKGPTIRHEAFKDYKANRKPMPEDLAAQIPVLKKILKAMRIPTVELEKYEADDVLGSLAKKASSQKIHSVLVSTDKDLYQLVNDSTTLYNPAKETHMDEKAVEKHFGVPPSQVVDVLALWGDPSDNIPGVPGVGEKTSKALLQQFRTLENLLANLDQIEKPPLREKIKDNLNLLRLSRQLVTIINDLDVVLDLKDLAVSEPNYEELIPLLQELEFSGMLSECLERQDMSTKEYHVIDEQEQLQKLVSQIRKSKRVSLDTETDCPFPTRARLVGMSFSVKPDQAFYLPLGHDYAGTPTQLSKETAFRILSPVLSDPKIKKRGQNIKYDFIVLRREGLTLQGIELDTMVLSYLLEPNWGKHNLGKLALHYLHKKSIPYEEIVGKGKNQVTMNAVDIKRVAPYACQDADFAMALSEQLWPKVKEHKLDGIYREFDLPLIAVLANMEAWGVKIDPGRLKDLSEEIQESLDRLSSRIFEISGEEFNLNSPSQLANILFEKMRLPTSRRTKVTKGYSTSVNVLQDLAQNYPIAQHALEHRQLAKLKSTYADALPLMIHPQTGRIHTSYNQTVAATGRLSSSDPNLQNIPARGEWGPRFRQAFIPEKGHLFLSADYSQIELRVLAHLSEDPGLIETFSKDQDIHQETAARVFANSSTLFPEEQRRRAKIINFSMIYGASAFSLARELEASNAEAQTFIDLYYEKYPNVKEYLEKSVTDALESGVAKTLFGRQRQIPELKQKDRSAQQFGRRIALNTPIQGTAADLMKKAMIDIGKDIKNQGLGAKMILQVHDELVFEVPKSEVEKTEALVKERMESVYPLRVPLKVHLGWGANWAEAK